MLKHAKLLLGVSFGLNLMLLYIFMFRQSGTKVVAEFDVSSKKQAESVHTHNQAESPHHVHQAAYVGNMVGDSLHKIKNSMVKQNIQHVTRAAKNRQNNKAPDHNLNAGSYVIQDKINVDGGLYNDNVDNAQPLIPSQSIRIVEGKQGNLIHQLVKTSQPSNGQQVRQGQQVERRQKIGQQAHQINFQKPRQQRNHVQGDQQGYQSQGGQLQQPQQQGQQIQGRQFQQTGQHGRQAMENVQPIHEKRGSRHKGNQIQREQFQQANELNVQTAENEMSFVPTDERMRVYNWNGQTWMGNRTVCNNLPMFRKTTLFSHFGHTPIFVHDPKEDKWISDSLIRNGNWEPDVSKAVTNALGTDPDLMLLDIGANIGVVSLVSALMGRPVISIEPLRANVQRLCASYRAGQLTDHVAIVLNAISDKHENVSLGRDLNNVGGTFVINENPNKAQSNDVSFDGSYRETVPTILLDDLLTLFPKNVLDKVVIKMDVEGYEDHVLRGAERFFKEVHVRAVVLEWTYSKQQNTAEYIKQFLLRQNLLPFDITMSNNLFDTPSTNWPTNVVWLNKLYLRSR